MSYPKKTKGYRGITVEGIRYRWLLRSGPEGSWVTLQGTESGGQQAVVWLRGVPDFWLSFPGPATRIVNITPKLVRRMVQQALAQGWEPMQRGGMVSLDYVEEEGR